MPNQYLCETEFDELSPDDSIIDHAFLSEDNFVLILLLTSNGTASSILPSYRYLQASCVPSTDPARSLSNGERSSSAPCSAGNPSSPCRFLASRIVDPVAICLSPDASFLVIACIDCTLHVIPIKSVLVSPRPPSSLFPLQSVNWGNEKSIMLKSGPFQISISTTSI